MGGRFSRIPEKAARLAARGGSVGGAELRVLIALGLYADAEGTCWPSLKTIADKTGLSERNVRRARDRLVESGVVTAERRQEGGRALVTIYCLASDPVMGDPVMGDPVMGDPVMGDPVMGEQFDRVTRDPLTRSPVTPEQPMKQIIKQPRRARRWNGARYPQSRSAIVKAKIDQARAREAAGGRV